MIQNITFGQYFPIDSAVHRLDPRIKIAISLALIVAVFCIRSWIGYAVNAAFILAAVLVSKLPVKNALKSIKPLRVIIIITFILNVFFYKGENLLFSWWIFSVYSEGIAQAAKIAVRLLFLIEATTLLMQTTSAMEITYGLEMIMSPLKKVVPVHEIAMMMSIAMRFIPTLIEETDKIMKAQTARGAEFDSGNIFKRAAGLVPLLVPLFVGAFKRAEELAVAMESRCYNGGEHRTRMKVLKISKCDIFAVLITAAAITLMVWDWPI